MGTGLNGISVAGEILEPKAYIPPESKFLYNVAYFDKRSKGITVTKCE